MYGLNIVGLLFRDMANLKITRGENAGHNGSGRADGMDAGAEN